MLNTDEAKAILLKQREELEERQRRIQADLAQGRSRDSEDQAQERENDDVLDALAADAGERLRKVQRALAKIDEKSYGLCDKCGEPIAEARLQSVPTAEYCMECAD